MDVTLVVVGGKHAGKQIPVSVPEFTIGRGQECQLRLKSDVISRKHCAILVEKGVATIKDFGSTNGTFLNGERLGEPQELKHGDHISIGVLEVEVQLPVVVAGKMKPKVRTVQEAAARTVASAAASDEWDITNWLAAGKSDAEKDDVIAPVSKPASVDDTETSKSVVETGKVAVNGTVKMGAKKKEATPEKPASRFHPVAKPMAENSGEAANDILRKFFSRKRK